MLAWLLGMYILLLVGVYIFQRAIILHPTPLSSTYAFQFQHPFTEHFLPAADGHSIHALYFKTAKERAGVVLYLHGNADNLQRWGQNHEDFTSLGYDFFVIEYRGFGKSRGRSSEKNMVADARTAYEWLREQFPADCIVIYGRSLGSGVATALAKDVPARLLVLETPFDSMKGAFQARVPGLFLPFPLRFQFNNADKLRNISYPVYIFHGTEDQVVPLKSAIKLKPLLKEEDAFFLIEGGAHKDLNTFFKYQDALRTLLTK